ncbi:hypothetical protein Tco_1360186 [Tanacetum coccineum]
MKHSYYVSSFVDRMPPKRTSTSETPVITLDAIRQLINDGISSALKAQVVTMANSDNSNRNTEPREIHIAKRGNYKEFINFNLSTSRARRELYDLIHGLNVLSQCFLVASVPNSDKLMVTFIEGKNYRKALRATVTGLKASNFGGSHQHIPEINGSDNKA